MINLYGTKKIFTVHVKFAKLVQISSLIQYLTPEIRSKFGSYYDFDKTNPGKPPSFLDDPEAMPKPVHRKVYPQGHSSDNLTVAPFPSMSDSSSLGQTSNLNEKPSMPNPGTDNVVTQEQSSPHSNFPIPEMTFQPDLHSTPTGQSGEITRVPIRIATKESEPVKTKSILKKLNDSFKGLFNLGKTTNSVKTPHRSKRIKKSTRKVDFVYD
jgi:hypothetical protein